MIFTTRAARARIQRDYDKWLEKHRDPRDPLTAPVELMMQLFLAASSWKLAMGGLLVVLILMTVVDTTGHWIALRLSPMVTMTHRDEARAMQAWIDSGQAVRLMRCEGVGVEYEGNGYCHTVGRGAWKMPPQAVARIEEEHAAEAQPTTFKNPFTQ